MGEITPWRKLRFHQRLARLGLGLMMVGGVVALIDNFYGAIIVAGGLTAFVVAASISNV